MKFFASIFDLQYCAGFERLFQGQLVLEHFLRGVFVKVKPIVVGVFAQLKLLIAKNPLVQASVVLNLLLEPGELGGSCAHFAL